MVYKYTFRLLISVSLFRICHSFINTSDTISSAVFARFYKGKTKIDQLGRQHGIERLIGFHVLVETNALLQCFNIVQMAQYGFFAFPLTCNTGHKENNIYHITAVNIKSSPI